MPLSNIQDNGINLTHIESRPADSLATHFEFYVDCFGSKATLDPVLKELEEKAEKVKVFAGENEEGRFNKLVGGGQGRGRFVKGYLCIGTY